LNRVIFRRGKIKDQPYQINNYIDLKLIGIYWLKSIGVLFTPFPMWRKVMAMFIIVSLSLRC